MGGGFNQNLLMKFMFSKVCENIQNLFKMLMIFFFGSLQKIMTFLTRNFSRKNPSYGFFTPMSNLNKKPFWISCFGLDHFD
jgi:hypothetical protein